VLERQFSFSGNNYSSFLDGYNATIFAYG